MVLVKSTENEKLYFKSYSFFLVKRVYEFNGNKRLKLEVKNLLFQTKKIYFIQFFQNEIKILPIFQIWNTSFFPPKTERNFFIFRFNGCFLSVACLEIRKFGFHLWHWTTIRKERENTKYPIFFSELLNINIVNTCQRKTKIQMAFLKRQKQNVR